MVVLPPYHPLAKTKRIKVEHLKSLFFFALSEETHPGSRDWLCDLCQQAGFTPRILQDVGLESGLMTFVAEGLGVTLAREQIKYLLHPGVVFRPLASSMKADFWIAWHRENRSKALGKYIEIVKSSQGPHASPRENHPPLRIHSRELLPQYAQGIGRISRQRGQSLA